MPANLKSNAENFLIGVRGSTIHDSDSLWEMPGLPASPLSPTDTVVVSLVILLVLLLDPNVHLNSEIDFSSVIPNPFLFSFI